MNSPGAPLKDKFFGVIAINENCDGFVSMYKKGDQTKPTTPVDDLDKKGKVSGKPKKKKDHIERLIKFIDKHGTFMSDGKTMILEELVVATCGDYENDLEKLSKYCHNSPQYISLPECSKDPIADAIRLRDEETKKEIERGNPVSEMVSSPTNTSSTHSYGTHQNISERDSHSDPKTGKGSTPMEEDSSSIASRDSGTSGTIEASNQSATSETDQTKTSGSMASNQDEKGPTAVDEMLTNIMKAMQEMQEMQVGFDNKIEKLMSRVNDIDNKLIDIQQKSSATKSQAPLPPGVPVRYSPSPVTTQSLLYNLRHAPSKVSKIENQFCDRLEQKFSSDKKQLQEDVTGPSLVFAINSSRIKADLQRDLNLVTFTGPTLLMIIVPTREPDRTPPRLLSDDLAGFPVEGKNCHYLLVDNNNTGMHDCGVNSDTVDAVAKFIAKNQSAKK